jgi:plasmid stabilization system protein ParE
VIDYRLSNDALADLEEIRRYITERDSESAADNLEIQIFDAFDEPVRLPMVGHQRFDVKQDTLLFHNVSEYVIQFRREPWVVILRVVHGVRDMTKLF